MIPLSTSSKDSFLAATKVQVENRIAFGTDLSEGFEKAFQKQRFESLQKGALYLGVQKRPYIPGNPHIHGRQEGPAAAKLVR